jgi:capsular exopolysaccharide synthesis family protein
MTSAGTRVSEVPGEVRFLKEIVAGRSRAVPIIESVKDAHSIVGEELRLLRARVRKHCLERQHKLIAVTSALPGDGKSMVALGLAAALAREAAFRVLLLEADLRRPSISQTLGLDSLPGLSEWLEGKLDQLPLFRYQPAGFCVLTAGQDALEKPETLGSSRMDALLRSARAQFDFVVVDTSPILPVADTVVMQDLLDCYLLVVRSRLTPREAILDASRKLEPQKIIGLVLNDHTEYRTAYRAHAYKRYGMASAPRPTSARERGR